MENEYLQSLYKIDSEILEKSSAIEISIKPYINQVEEIANCNQYKVIKAFQDCHIAEMHFNPSSGYGYGDLGREKLDQLFANVFKGEDAIVRQSLTSGTVAINLAIAANLRPKDEILFITGRPYDTIAQAVGISGNQLGSLNEYGITYRILELTSEGNINFNKLSEMILPKTAMIFIQRSRGYEWRTPVMCEDIKKAAKIIKAVNKKINIFVDNCYGEFVETNEPLECGAHLIAGSLIKNPGGGIAPSGGYIVGRKDLIAQCAARLYSPGLQKEVGSSTGDKRLLFQGLYLAPKIVSEALKGAIYSAAMLREFGFDISPLPEEIRGDIVQLIRFNNKEELISFCQSIQKSSPIDSHVTPYPWDMPGYDDQIIMAAGTFVQGASIEFSADAPLKEPYIAYLQGGMVYSQIKLGILLSLQTMKNSEII